VTYLDGFHSEIRALRSDILVEHGERCHHQIAGHCPQQAWLVACTYLDGRDLGHVLDWLRRHYRSMIATDYPTINRCIAAYEWQHTLMGAQDAEHCKASSYVAYYLTMEVAK
jgi:hypothetical protein